SWNGTSWSALGAGIGGFEVFSLLTLPHGDVAVGGDFAIAGGQVSAYLARWNWPCERICDADFNRDGAVATDADIDAFFACFAGNCCPTCGSADFNGDG